MTFSWQPRAGRSGQRRRGGSDSAEGLSVPPASPADLHLFPPPSPADLPLYPPDQLYSPTEPMMLSHNDPMLSMPPPSPVDCLLPTVLGPILVSAHLGSALQTVPTDASFVFQPASPLVCFECFQGLCWSAHTKLHQAHILLINPTHTLLRRQRRMLNVAPLCTWSYV